MWAFLSLKTNSARNFSQVRLSKHLQAEWRNPGHQTRDLRRPEAKSFSCLLKLRSSQGCMRTAEQGSSGRTLSFLLLPLSTGLPSPSAETTWAAGTDSTFKVLFSSLSGTNPLLATSSLTQAHTLQGKLQHHLKPIKVCSVQQTPGVFGNTNLIKTLWQQHPCAPGGSHKSPWVHDRGSVVLFQ